MKKLLIILLFTLIPMSLFGFYGDGSGRSFIDFLMDKDQLRARTDQIGFLYGTEHIRVAFGVTGNTSGVILDNWTNDSSTNNKLSSYFRPSVALAVGYKSDLISVGGGYNFQFYDKNYGVHTPVLMLTALENSFRMAIPISIGVGQNELKNTLAVSTMIEARYYFNTILNHLRFYFNYGNATIKEVNFPSTNFTQQSVGFQLRAYFNYDFSSYNMKLTPIIRLQFDMALATKYNNIEKTTAIVDNYYITAKGFAPSGGARIGGVNISTGANADLNNGELKGGYIASIPSPSSYYAEEPYRIGLAFPVGFRAMNESKTIELYVEPALSLTIVNAKNIYSLSAGANRLIREKEILCFILSVMLFMESYMFVQYLNLNGIPKFKLEALLLRASLPILLARLRLY